MYKLFDNGISKAIIRTMDNAFIPIDIQNSDYQAYLKFIEDGGVPLPAEDIV